MWLLTAVGFFLLAVVCHAVSRRVVRTATAVLTFVAWGGIVGGLFVVYEYTRFAPAPATVGILVYALACELYIFLFTLVAHSVSAVLIGVLRHGARRPEELEALYNPETMVEKRKKQMVKTGLLVTDGAAYRVSERGNASSPYLDGFGISFSL